MSDVMPEEEFYLGLLKGYQAFGTIDMVGNISISPEDLRVATVGNNNGWGIPSVKPQSQVE